MPATALSITAIISTSSMPLHKIAALTSRANEQGLSYCHWKTNLELDKALSGIDDLDILVDLADFPAFNKILLDEGFRQAESITSKHQPGIFHFLGNDDETGTLINAHIHVRTLTGDHFLKSWALPFEQMLLENCSLINGMPIPDRSSELIIYIARSMIKQASLFDFMLHLKSHGKSGKEMSYLMDGFDKAEVTQKLARFLPEIPPGQFFDAVKLLEEPGNTLRKLLLGLTFKRRLIKYRRYSLLRQNALTITVITKMLYNRIIPGHKHMALRTGGKIVALIGPQATGKSTIARELKKWLGVELSVVSIHAGKPPRSLATFIPALAIPLARKLMPGKTTVNIEKDAVDDESGKFPLIFVIRKVMLAWDRRKLLRKVFQQSRNGKVIISDRYPSDVVGAIDGATFRNEVIEKEPSVLKKTLMKLERKLYQDVCPPDIVLQLTVSKEKAIERNLKRVKKGPKQTTDYVKLRHAMKHKPKFERTPVLTLSTDQDFDEMILNIKQKVWKYL